MWVSRFCKRCWKGFEKASGLAWTRGTVYAFFFFKQEPVAVSNEVPFRPFVCAETLKTCALIGPHLLAAEGEAGSSGSQSPDLGDMW